jgi:hypothetical protein
LKKFLATILVIALYAPIAAQWLAYTECEVAAMLNNKPDCDCKIANTPQPLQPANTPNKHQEIVQRTNWQYVVHQPYALTHIQNNSLENDYSLYQAPQLPCLLMAQVFHPPARLCS